MKKINKDDLFRLLVTTKYKDARTLEQELDFKIDKRIIGRFLNACKEIDTKYMATSSLGYKLKDVKKETNGHLQ